MPVNKLNIDTRKLYSKIRNNLPLKGQSFLTRIAFRVSGKPIVKKGDFTGPRFPSNQKGGMILSADFELAWANRYSKSAIGNNKYISEKGQLERSNIPRLVLLFEKYDIPITWATVGHLFLSESMKEDFKCMKKMPYFDTKWISFSEGDWYDNVPFSSWENAKEWYAPDLIKIILNSSVKHEFGTHTFSHINFSDNICPPDVAEDDLKAAFDAMGKFQIKPVSICFPAGSWGNVPVLKKFGIRIYRRKIAGLNLAYPYYDEHGLLVTLSTDSFDRLHHNWTPEYYQYRYKTAIKKAIRTGTIAHFMFHPSMDPWMITEVMDDVMAFAKRLQEEGLLWIGTMSDISSFINRNINPE